MPAGVGSHWMWPCTVAPSMTLDESMRCGRSKLVYSIVTGRGVPRVMTVASNRVPTPIGPGSAWSPRSCGVVARLVALVGHDVEDHLDRAGDVQAAPYPAHEVASRWRWSSFQPTSANQVGRSSP